MKKYNWKQLNESFFNDIEDDIIQNSIEDMQSTLYHDKIIINIIQPGDIDLYINNKIYTKTLINNKPIEIKIDGDITNLVSAFNGNSIIKTIDLSDFDTINVTSMKYMFQDCISLQNINLQYFNTSNCKNMQNMFKNCKSLKSLDLSSFNMSNVANMSYMFCGCKSLKSLDLSNFDTSNLNEVINIFDGCVALQSLDLSNFNLSHITELLDIKNMFKNCNKLNYIRCTKEFRNWCWQNANTIKLPTQMLKDNTGVWDLI